MSENEALQKDVVISSRVRLARNYADMAFPPNMDEETAKEVVARVETALEDAPKEEHYTLHRVARMTAVDRQMWMENHLASPDLFQRPEAALVTNEEKTVSIMVDEEDHLRIQAILPGLQLGKAAGKAVAADAWLEKSATFAFDEEWGYLTSCPTNTGTGMRASAMLHLPAIAISQQIQPLIQAVSKVGLTVRGFYGEGSEAMGDLYQVSNQVTLGKSEEDIVSSVQAACRELAERERLTAQALCEAESLVFEDKIWRAYGALTNARIIDSKEFMTLWSSVRLGINLGILPASLDTIDKLMQQVQPAAIIKRAGQLLPELERSKARADFCRSSLAQV